MDDLISRKALIEKCQSWHGHGWQHNMCLEKDIRNAPSIDAEPVRRGEWFDKGSLSCRCSKCGCKNTRESAYCPNCGAKMDAKEE